MGSDFNSFNQSALKAFTQSALKARCGGAGAGAGNEWVHDFDFQTISANLTPFDMAGFGGNLYVCVLDTSGAHKVYKRTGVATYSQLLTSLNLAYSGVPTIFPIGSDLYLSSQHSGTARVYNIKTGSLVEETNTNLIGSAAFGYNGSYLFWFLRRTSPKQYGARRDGTGSWTWGVSSHAHSGRMQGIQGCLGNIFSEYYYYSGTSTLTRTKIGTTNHPFWAKQIGSTSTEARAFNANATLHKLTNFTTGWQTSSPTFSPADGTPGLKITYYNAGIWYAAGLVNISGTNYFCIYETSGDGSSWTRTYLKPWSELNSLADIEWFTLQGTTMFCCAYDSIFRRELA